MLEVIPGILEKEWSEIERKIKMVKQFAKTIHIDLLDGKFAANTTFLDPLPFKKYSDEIFFELHMMVDDPQQYLQDFADAGFKRFLGHVEKMPSQEDFVAEGQMLGEVGLAIDGKTPVSAVTVPFEDMDTVLVITINAGFSALQFTPENLKKVEEIRGKNLQQTIAFTNTGQVESQVFPIAVDGGINDKTILEAKNAGATRFVASSFIFGSQNPSEQYQILQSIIKQS